MENIIEQFDKVLSEAVQVKASDIHLCVGSPWKYRVNGHINPLDMKTLEMSECESIVRHILMQTSGFSEENIDKTIKDLQDRDCSYMLPGVARFRVNICRQRGSFSVVLRVVPFEIPTPDSGYGNHRKRQVHDTGFHD
jgi:twitching motility protein PilT